MAEAKNASFESIMRDLEAGNYAPVYYLMGDEPYYIDKIEQIVKEMREIEGLTVLLIEHNMHFVRKVADICAYLDGGQIIQVGETATVLDNETVRNSYMGL